MKVNRIRCDEFLGISNIDFVLPYQEGITVITGSNGSGKTSLLKLINLAVARAGFGMEYQAGLSREWIGENFDFSVELEFSEQELDGFGEFASTLPYQSVPVEMLANWDRRLIVTKSFEPYDLHSSSKIDRTFGGIDVSYSNQLAYALPAFFDHRNQLKSMFIDANRAYPGDQNRHSIHLRFDEFEDFHNKRNSAAAKSLDAYNQILDYLSLMEGRSLSRSRGRGRTDQAGNSDLLIGYSDPLEDIQKVLSIVLPHLKLLYADPNERMMYFERGGAEIPFSHLSGGEREIVFLAAQIIRMKVNDGILLIDEPELHLNPELVRQLVESIASWTGSEQVFLATHSYEVVESVGAERTLILDRNIDSTRSSLSILADSHITLTLANTLGRVGFTRLNQTVVMIEGGLNSLRAVPRFEALLQGMADVSVIKYGTTKVDVLNRYDAISGFASLEDVAIGTACIVDMDFDSLNAEPLDGSNGIYQTKTHEIENLFLEPESLLRAIQQVDPNITEIRSIIAEMIDSRAGRWIWGHMSFSRNSDWKNRNVDRKLLRELQVEFERLDWLNCTERLADYKMKLGDLIDEGGEHLVESHRVFSSLRSCDENWRHCLGKELLEDIARKFGWSDSGLTLERIITRLWFESPDELPTDLQEMRDFVASRSVSRSIARAR